MKQLYFIRFFPNRDGFCGWNTEYASNLDEAKAGLLKRLSLKAYQDIDWTSLKIGKEAEIADSQMETAYAGCFR